MALAFAYFSVSFWRLAGSTSASRSGSLLLAMSAPNFRRRAGS